MGSSGSKDALQAARKYPTRAARSAVPPRASPPASSRAPAAARASQPAASFTKDDGRFSSVYRVLTALISLFWLTEVGAAIRADGIDPARPDAGFAERLKQMGIAQPNPTYSPSSTAFPRPDEPTAQVPGPSYPSSTNNTTLGVLEARRHLQQQADREFELRGKASSSGREFLDAGLIRKILILRQQGTPAADIESQFKLKKGVVNRLGPIGVVEATHHIPINDTQFPSA
jgi:hypothetical protein